MNQDFYKQIKSSTAHTQSRIDNANFVLQNLNLLPELISFSFNVRDKQHIRACCILEKVFELQMGLSYQYLELICNNLCLLKNDSAIRSISRFVMLFAKANSKNNLLNDSQIEKIVEVNFDWLISDYRVAVKHHAICTLFEMGKKQNWIHDELRNIVEKDAANHSIGYKVVARNVLKLI